MRNQVFSQLTRANLCVGDHQFVSYSSVQVQQDPAWQSRAECWSEECGSTCRHWPQTWKVQHYHQRNWQMGAQCWLLSWFSQRFWDFHAIVREECKRRVRNFWASNLYFWRSCLSLERTHDRHLAALHACFIHQARNWWNDVLQAQRTPLAYHWWGCLSSLRAIIARAQLKWQCWWCVQRSRCQISHYLCQSKRN